MLQKFKMEGTTLIFLFIYKETVFPVSTNLILRLLLSFTGFIIKLSTTPDFFNYIKSTIDH